MAHVIRRGGRYVRDDDYIDDDAPVVAAAGPLTFVARIIWFLTGILLAILTLRFLLVLLGANPGNGFVNFIYDVSHPFVAPFFNLFNYNYLDNGIGRFEIYTLVAMVIYGLIGWGLARLLTLGRPTAPLE